MFPVIEVECPYCKATGQIMTPPLGSIIVGPCPRCNEMVLLFDGSVMPLDKDIINKGTPEEKKQHLLETILDLEAGKIDDLIDSGELGSKQGTQQERRIEKEEQSGQTITPSIDRKRAPAINKEDVKAFHDIYSHLIDKKNFFESVFGGKKQNKGRAKENQQ